MAFIRRSFSAAANSLVVPRAIAIAIIIAMVGQLVPSANAEPAPRKILSGWIPYYGMSTSLPTAVANADLINEVMPFWYTFKLNTKTKAP